MTALLALLLACLAAGGAAGSAAAAESEATHVDVSLLAETASVSPGEPFHVGVRMVPDRGWHTYWKNPGGAGLPLRITWTLPEGFSAGDIEWPAPERISANSLVSYGYGEAVLIPIEIVPPARIDAASVTIAGKFDWLECSDACVPGSAELHVTLPVGRGLPARGRDAEAFARARRTIPEAPEGWTFAAVAGPRAISLAVEPPADAAPRSAYLFVDRPLVADYAEPQGFERVGKGFRLTLKPAANAPDSLGRLTGVLIVEGGGAAGGRTAVTLGVPVDAGDPDPAPAQALPPAGAASPTGPHDGLLIVVAGLGAAILLYRTATGLGASPPPA